MADYNLHGLNPRDFQHLVQAIARKSIAAGVTAFGDGKDGNRDLTYKGKMDYPSITDAWDGYLVMGCKFHQRPSGDSKDRTWALKQLEGDLKKFLNKRRKLAKPNYYIFVTNVALSGIATTGGRDRASDVLKKFSAKLRLKNYAVWDYSDLRTFLDGDADLRAAYGHFITTGDVLAQVMELLKLQRADFVDVMHAFLQKELIADMSAKLQSAGEDPEVQIPLANVFVDLPFADSAEAAVLTIEEEESKLPAVVHALLEAGSFILRRTPDDDEAIAGRRGRLSRTKTSRFVIVGGPGQGKSTFGQYLCQLYRAAILQNRPAERLDDQVPKIVRQLDKERKHVGGLPLTRRFPIRIELKNFAHALAGDSELTLLEYMRRDIARLGSATVSLEDLKMWLGQYPWVLVLDGLDEVPPSSNRTDVLREVDSFRVDAASSNSDMLVVATTRPQSYSKEFSEELFQHLYLTPLSPSQALRYGRKLAEARCGADERRRDELLRSLEKACENPATSRLMQSPLQVTIMATLLEDTGEPPQQRYRLFAEYYRTIYKRETRRKLLGGILTERQKDIDTIHSQAGLLLHAAGEKSSANSNKSQGDDVDSALSDEQFRRLVRHRLQQIGVPSTKATELLDRISDGSLQRLVFLVRPREGWVRFDVTSFKEFMAAEAIMTGSDEEIRERIRVIAPATHWRNVFQFAVGKCFVEREHLLDNFVSLCIGLNEDKACAEILGDAVSGRAAKAVLWGSRLALDILADGTARQYPGYEFRFARVALQLARIADQESAALLASVFHDDLQELYREVIDDRLGQSNLLSQLGAWYLLESLADREVSWATKELDERLPSDVDAQRAILFSRPRGSPSRWVAAKAAELAPRHEPHLLAHQMDFWPMREVRSSARLGILRELIRGGRHLEVQNRSMWGDLVPELYINKSHQGSDLWNESKTIVFDNEQWFPLISGARFGADPSAKSLSDELRWLAANWEPAADTRLPSLPWPLAACLSRCKSSEDLLRLATAAQDGLLGDNRHWNAAEQRWSLIGVIDDDFFAVSDGDLPLHPEVSTTGFPFAVAVWSGRMISQPRISRLLENLRLINNTETAAWLAKIAVTQYTQPRGAKTFISAGDFRALCSLASRSPRLRVRSFWLDQLLAAAPSGALDSEWIDLFDWLGREGEWFGLDNPNICIGEDLNHHFCANPEGRRGLLPILAEYAVSGCRYSIPQPILDMVKNWGPRAKDDAIGLSLGRDNLNEAEITLYANEISKSDSLELAVWRALKIAQASSLEQAGRFALGLLTILGERTEHEVHAEFHARRVLNELLTNRPSLLQESAVWKRLNLPQQS